ncbi:unnamed protein product, partial [Didymodactylos carnosus]
MHVIICIQGLECDGAEKAKELDEHKALAVNNVEGLTTTGDLEASAVRLA